MREKVNSLRLQQFMKALGATVKRPGSVYLVGGATAVLIGWRESTIDVDLKLVPDNEILKALPRLKDTLQLNVELASPEHFISGWQERSRFVQGEGPLDFFHYDFYGQALAKIERGHEADLNDVQQMIDRRLVNPSRMLELFTMIEDSLYKYPAIDRLSFRRAVEHVVGEAMHIAPESQNS